MVVEEEEAEMVAVVGEVLLVEEEVEKVVEKQELANGAERYDESG